MEEERVMAGGQEDVERVEAMAESEDEAESEEEAGMAG